MILKEHSDSDEPDARRSLLPQRKKSLINITKQSARTSRRNNPSAQSHQACNASLTAPSEIKDPLNENNLQTSETTSSSVMPNATYQGCGKLPDEDVTTALVTSERSSSQEVHSLQRHSLKDTPCTLQWRSLGCTSQTETNRDVKYHGM